jgi:regulatory protein YycH of two-component signal transduction system YycFG
MARLPEFNRSNVTVYLLGAFIVMALILAFGFWLFYSPARGGSLQEQNHLTKPNRDPAH